MHNSIRRVNDWGTLSEKSARIQAIDIEASRICAQLLAGRVVHAGSERACFQDVHEHAFWKDEQTYTAAACEVARGNPKPYQTLIQSASLELAEQLAAEIVDADQDDLSTLSNFCLV